MNRGLYIHIPFCFSKCPYCNFYSLCGNQRENKERFVEKLLLDLNKNKNKKAKTLYIGGGSPGSLSETQLEKIITTATKSYEIEGEKTIELNPVEVTQSLAKSLAESGINRVSLGVQTFNPDFRKILGRKGEISDIFNSVSILKDCGIKNISADLMFGLPDQTMKDLNSDLNMIKALDVKHVSCYILKIEKNTVFYKKKENLNLPSDDLIADMYLNICAFLEKINLKQYEISNFAKPNFESRHNLNYWKDGEYYAFGPSAHLYINGERHYYSDSLKDYLEDKPLIYEGKGGSDEEKLMLALRLKRGISIKTAGKYKDKIEEMKSFFETRNNRVCLNTQGFLISNSIMANLLE